MVVYFDGEYSGLDVRGGHGIISLAAIDGDNFKNKFEIECRVQATQTYDSESLKYVGIEPKKIYSFCRATLDDGLTGLTEFFKSCNNGVTPCLVSMNNPKDLEHLNNGYERLGISERDNPLHYRNIDLHSAAHSLYLIMGREIPSKDNLESVLNSRHLSELVGIPAEPNPHSTAIRGAEQTAEIHKRLVLGEKFLPMFDEFEIPEYLLKFHELKKELQLSLNK